MRDVAGAFAFEDVVVDAIAVQVAHEDGVAILFGPIVAQVDHGADVGMAAARLAMRPDRAARAFPGPARPVNVIGATGHQRIPMRVEILAEHPLKVRPWDDVPEVLDDAV